MAGTLTIATLSDGTNSTSSTNCIQGSAKAWVNFDGTGTVAIRSSYNVSSVTDNGTGDYTVNFTNAFADANYSWSTGTSNFSNADNRVFLVQKYSTSAPTTTSCRFQCADTGSTASDIAYLNISFFR